MNQCLTWNFVCNHKGTGLCKATVVLLLFCLMLLNISLLTSSITCNAQTKETNQLLRTHSKPAPARKRVQTIVILPGPHKTGSTSTQTILSQWFSNKHPAFTNWSWPTLSPWLTASSSDRKFSPKDHAEFADGVMGFAHFGHWVSKEVLKTAKDNMQRDWEAGKSIVIASEIFDRLTLETPVTSAQKQWLVESKGNQTLHQILWKNLLEFLPSHPDVSRKIFAGILFRESRSDHLVSLWHQFGGNRSLSDFITKGPLFAEHIYFLNSLKVAQVMQGSEGVDKTYILNTAGLERANKNVVVSSLGLAIACQIMKVPCHQTSSGQWYLEGDPLPTASLESPAKANKRRDKGVRDLNQSTLDAINSVLQEYDCEFENHLSEGIGYLFFDKPIFSECKSREAGKQTICSSDLQPEMFPIVSKIQNIACQALSDCHNL